MVQNGMVLHPWNAYYATAYPPSYSYNPYYRHIPQTWWGAYAQNADTAAQLSQIQEYYRRCRRQPLTFVLIHGAWADAGFWEGTAAELRKQGHTVYVPEYPGHGADPNKKVTHAMLTSSLVKYIEDRNLKEVVLVGHSFGGSLVQTVAQTIPDRIRRIVFLDAFVLQDGESLADQLPPASRQAFQQIREASADDTIMLPFSLFRETFVNLAPLPLAKDIYGKIPAEPAGPLFEKLDLKNFYKLQTPRSYVYLTEDNVLPQGEGYGWHPHMSSRLGLFRLIKDKGDHMTTAKAEPKRLAERIYEAARD